MRGPRLTANGSGSQIYAIYSQAKLSEDWSDL